VQVSEIAPGLWRWTAYHEELRQDVGCVYVEAPDAVCLVDPLVAVAVAAGGRPCRVAAEPPPPPRPPRRARARLARRAAAGGRPRGAGAAPQL